MVTVETVMRQVRNFFERAYIQGTYVVADGKLVTPEALPDGAWVAIEGSSRNDGVYQLASDDYLTGGDEEFSGRVWLLFPPAHFLTICEKIAEFDQKTPVGAFQSETLGEYSYTRASGKNGAVMTWQEAFAAALKPYRRMFTEVGI